MAIDRSLSLIVKFTGIDKLTGKMRAIGGASKKTASDIGATRKEIDRLQQAQARISAYRDMEVRFRSGAQAIEEQRQKLAVLRAEKDKAEGSTKRLTRSIEAAERKEARLTERHEQQGMELQQLSRDLDRAGVNVAELARHEERLGHELYESNKRLQQQRQELERNGRIQAGVQKWQRRGSAMQGAGMTAGIAGAAITAPLVIGSREAIRFESAMADVRKVVDGMEDSRAFAAMGRDIIQLSRELPIAAEGLAQIVAAGGQAGIAANELLPFTRNAAQMGVAFDIDPGQAGETMAKWRTAFRMTQGEVVQLADKVNWLSDKTAAAPDQISAIVTRVGPLGEVAGLAAGEIAAMGATLTSMGVSEEIAATGIKNTMLALTKGAAATKNQKKAYASLGLESSAVAQSMQRDATGTIMNVMQKIAALPDYQRASILDQLFGSESISAIAPLLTQLPTLRQNLNMVGERGGWAGSMMNEFGIRSQTTENRLQRFNNRIDALKMKVGDQLLPVIEKGADMLGGWADRFSSWADANPTAAKGLVMLVAGVGAFLTVFGAAALIIGTVIGPIATGVAWMMKLGGIVKLLTFPFKILGQLALWAIGAVAAFVGLPAWVVGAIAIALVAAGVLIYKNWDKIKGWFFQGMTFLLNLRAKFLSIGVQLMVGLINGISSRFAALKAKLLDLGKKAVGWFKNVLGIKSPSRVFMGLGSFLTEGLTMGVDRGAAEPLARMRRLAGQMSAALAIGAAGTVPAAASPQSAAAGGSGSGAKSIHHHTYHIHISGGGGDLRQQAQELLDEIKRLQRAERGSSYEDDDE